MNKQELLNVFKNQIIKESKDVYGASDTWIGGYEDGRIDALTFAYKRVKWLDAPEKPEIPHWLAERIEEYNIDSSIEFWRYVFNGSIFNPGERAWILDNDELISKIFLYGYTIEKEPVWVVRINEKLYFCRFTDKYFEKDSDAPTYIESGNPSLIKKFTNKDKAKAVATLVDGTVEEWSE
ncbi:DUF1642 domain-containing protein [Tetragenococcus halophilus]|uniref:DUF1642 domain-containing protein n=1 Tax=Tetragenococcus halophilus (strain DSM 20338 / JCM 20259 / NCIMB 9735 / NBRC 12172) TaxID=945021 RepID=A0AAN1SHL8_TETHN|nr:DUF1642 domain-containing protein [Tetragenococcus halophilus]BAK95155.1 hypothetical protein TEH_18280 [Tetragenococcus halophilus NBRC 12172]GBD71099.1 putative uncharacterized protein [Tetragenococcus halophilus subsp. halophilus]